jgi:hypothetical protein
MLRTILICTLVSASALGCATTHQQPNAQPETRVAASNCPMKTGSHIPRPNECSGPGRSYSGTDLQSTGQTDLGQALQMLDPSITVHH